MDKHRFNVGDVITSSKNKKIKYLIKEVGVKNELGELDYVVEDVTENSPFNGRTHKMTINKIDAWGVLLKENENVPRFKVGDWVVNKFGDVWHIDSFDKKNYQVSNGNEYNYFPISKQNEMHLWNIQDAKEGDVLANDHHILILKELVYDWSSNGIPYSVKAYCGIKPNGNFEIGKDNWCFCGTLHIHPATKEQRDLLFQKMREKGYEWDNVNKNLKKIVEKSAWTEEDSKNLRNLICKIWASDKFDVNEAKYFEEWLIYLEERIKGE